MIGGVRAEMAVAIVTSQTCDLQEEKRISIRPFVTVARVFNATTEFDKSYLGHIQRHRVGDIIPLTAPAFQREGELWVADLRWEACLERSVMLDKHPIAAFGDEEGSLNFSRRIAGIRARVAISKNVADRILEPLETVFRSGAIDPEVVVEVRILCTPNTVDARTVEVHLLIADDADQMATQETLDTWYVETVERLDDAVTLVSADVYFASEYTRSRERGTERVNFDDMTASRI
ncbi:MAG: hypothetical protein ACREM6_11850 [Vulcanimicrobiaceae bacterium]